MLFAGSGQFFDSPAGSFDVLVVDEAHRLKGKGAYMYQGVNQIEDIIKASKVIVFFIDDYQRIRPDDIGTVEEIKRIARIYGSEVLEYELSAQFRCSGAEGFLNWIDHIFQIWLKNDNQQLTKLIKNIYKVLISRGMKGCFLYCRDPELQQYLKAQFGRVLLTDAASTLDGE